MTCHDTMECDLCVNPYPFMCNECQQDIGEDFEQSTQAMLATTRKIWIGSGEDGHIAEQHAK